MAECNDLKTGSCYTLAVQLYTDRKCGAVLIYPAHVAEAFPPTAAFLAGLVAWPELGGSTKMVTWYAKNMPRRMPLVPKMIEELVCSLPPLGEGKVVDLLSGFGTAAVEIKKVYPR